MGIQSQTMMLHFYFFKTTFLQMHQKALNIYTGQLFFGEKLVHLVLKKYSALTWKTSSILFYILMGSGIGIFLYPIIHWIFTQEFILVFGFILPLTNPNDSFSEYTGNFVYQAIKIISVAFFLTGAQLYVALFIVQACCQIDVIKALLTDIGNITIDNDNKNEKLDIRKKLQFIIKYHQNYLIYLSMMDKVLRWQLFVALACIIFQMALGILIVTKITWIPGYFTIIFGAVELFINCYFGTLIEIKNDELIKAIYATPWYLFEINDRKLMLTFLMASQNPKQLQFGQFLPINLETFMMVIKNIYTYLMLLMNFID